MDSPRESTHPNESRYAIELVVGFCSVPLLLAYRLAGEPRVSAVETAVWLALLWAVTSGVRTWVKWRRARDLAR
jgi:hypothetical protein